MIVEGKNGFPVLLADVPSAGVNTISTTQKSGNRAHDARSGKFGVTKGKKPPAPADSKELHRMLAAVRDAAREFDNPSEGDLREFLKGRAAHPDKVDIQNFMEQVKQQRLVDLADMLDQQFRATGPMQRGRRKVRVSAPKGYVRKALNNLTPDDVSHLGHLLIARGHDQAEVAKFFADKGYKDIQFSAEYEFDLEDMATMTDAAEKRGELNFTDALRAALSELPPPQVVVNIPEPKPREVMVVRDPETKLIERIEER